MRSVSRKGLWKKWHGASGKSAGPRAFSCQCILCGPLRAAPPQVFSTYSNEDYDRRNEDVDPMAASAEYELEKRVERLELFPVELEKGERPGQPKAHAGIFCGATLCPATPATC